MENLMFSFTKYTIGSTGNRKFDHKINLCFKTTYINIGVAIFVIYVAYGQLGCLKSTAICTESVLEKSRDCL